MSSEPKLKNRLDNNQNTLYDQSGGMPMCRRLSEIFHDHVTHDLILREIFPQNLARLTERFALFIAEQLGGAADYTAQRGKNSLRCRHAHLAIGTAEAERWIELMFTAIDEAGITEPTRTRLRDYFAEIAPILADPFLPYYHLPLEELQLRLEQNPALATTSDMGRTLLSHAVSQWDMPRVQMLLKYSADVNGEDRLGHAPLYHAATAHIPDSETKGCAVVELLIQHGADVNRRSGPKQTAPLHMAARRGHAAIAAILLNSSATLEIKDSKGETPLRRAVNCGQEGMVLFLLSRGADPLTRDKQGRPALAAARQERIRAALEESIRHR